jgi:glutamyl/glutaminyl-tRNA synthetase
LQEVEAEKAKGTPFCYRFRVPKHKDIVIKDTIRGDVKFNTDTLGDFVIMRSNGLPVYNFCVAADDALMQITHVIRAEEHLPNTLRQVGRLQDPTFHSTYPRTPHTRAPKSARRLGLQPASLQFSALMFWAGRAST